MDLELLRERARIFRGIRRFFDARDYLEVDTPVLAPNLIPETCLEVFRTEYLAPKLSRREPAPYWLVPSPELWMKRLLADHRTSLYQICRCFRNGESTGRLHSPEFTMLEYYTVGADYRDSLALTEDLFRALLPPDAPDDLKPPFLVLDMDDAFRRYAGFGLYEVAAKGAAALEAEARRLGLENCGGLGIADLYNLIFVHAVEPALPAERPVVLMDYPAFVPCLAKDRSDGAAKERWELYVRGIELANCYTEEGDAEKVRAYFRAESAEKERSALVPHGVDADYWKTFLPRRDSTGTAQPFPRCSGVAMGLDRLVMALVGRSSIDSVLPFPMG